MKRANRNVSAAVRTLPSSAAVNTACVAARQPGFSCSLSGSFSRWSRRSCSVRSLRRPTSIGVGSLRDQSARFGAGRLRGTGEHLQDEQDENDSSGIAFRRADTRGSFQSVRIYVSRFVSQSLQRRSRALQQWNGVLQKRISSLTANFTSSDYAARLIGSINVGSSFGARDELTRCDTGTLFNMSSAAGTSISLPAEPSSQASN